MTETSSPQPLPAISYQATRSSPRPFDLKQLLILIAWCVGIWVIVALACLFLGSTGLGWNWKGRHEPVLLASMVGAALGAAGVAYQSILRNSLADPYLLGVSSGAALWSYLWRIIPAGALPVALVMGGQQALAFTGAAISVAIAFLLASRRGRLEPITLLLVGVIVNAINGSIFLFVSSVRKGMPDASDVSFLIGGLQTTVGRTQLVIALCLVAIGWMILLALAGRLNVATLSTDEAQSLGVRIHQLRWVALVVASIMTASAVAVSGPIGFVGLICPHLARRIVGQDQRRAFPIATMLGAVLLAIADAISRWLSSATLLGTILPVGVLTGLLGGPFFLVLLWQRRRADNEGAV